MAAAFPRCCLPAARGAGGIPGLAGCRDDRMLRAHRAGRTAAGAQLASSRLGAIIPAARKRPGEMPYCRRKAALKANSVE